MNTKILMTSSAIILCLTGIILNFIPDETSDYFGWANDHSLQILFQILGALYFGFGMLNWMTRFNLMGGIYNRPVVIANFSHFLIAGLALAKGRISHSELPVSILIAGLLYVLFAILFGILLFRHPLKELTTGGSSS